MDAKALEQIINKTVEAIDNSKKEIYEIAESARRECKTLEEELKQLKNEVAEVIGSVEKLEVLVKESRKRLAMVSKNFSRYSEKDIKDAYDTADKLRVELAVKRQQEQHLIRKRNELEIRLKDAYKTVERADSLISNIGVVLEYLKGDLKEIGLQLKDMRQKQLLRLRIIKAQEEERQRVAREIHDGPAQSMSNVVLKAEICERLIDIDLEKAKSELRQLKKIVRDCLQDVRKIIYNLRPMSLDDLGLIPTLQRYFATFQEETGLLVNFNTRGVYENIRPVTSLAIFRIIQEAFSNINKHAKAKHVRVNLESLENEVRLVICDDGIGFELDEVKNDRDNMNGGFGLLSMRERVELLDGTFEISSRPGNGTKISISIPMIHEEAYAYE